MHICFYNHGLGDTGGVRVMLDMCTAYMEQGWKVSIIVNKSDDLAYALPPNVKVYKIYPDRLEEQKGLYVKPRDDRNKVARFDDSLKKNKCIVKIYISLKYLLFFVRVLLGRFRLRRDLARLGVNHFISLNMYNSLEYHYAFDAVANCILHLHNDIEDVRKRANFISFISFEKLIKKFKTVCICKTQKQRLLSRFSLRNDRIKVIYNPIDYDRILDMSSELVWGDEGYLVVVAALTTRKRIDRILSVLSLVNSERLLVLGDGPLRRELELKAKELGVESRVCFKGFVSNPYPYIKNAKCLVLTSDYEGLPTVLIEAHSLGVPAISLDCPTGPREILTGNHEQLLVKMSSEDDMKMQLKEKVEKVTKDRGQFLKFDLSPFSKRHVVDQWREVFRESK